MVVKNMSNQNADKITSIIIEYCQQKGYQCKKTTEANNFRLDISNYAERTIVNVYFTNTIVIQGKQNSLHTEMNELKEKINQGSTPTDIPVPVKKKSCTTKYDILLEDIREEIKRAFFDMNLELDQNINQNILYRGKINKLGNVITITQFKNGTLLLQGKTDRLFDESCDLIEKIANPAEKEVITRFISNDETVLEQFIAKYTEKLLELAEKNIRAKLGDVFDYLEPHDRKWFIASECLCLSDIPLPEFSPLVMPASKAYEGFVKKILVDIGLFDASHFQSKTATFAGLNDKTNPRRVAICDRGKYCDSVLERLRINLDFYRNFMMHSDSETITKVETKAEAETHVNMICQDTCNAFKYFQPIFGLK